MPVPTNNSIGTVKTTCDSVGCFQHHSLAWEIAKASPVTRETENGIVRPTPWAKWSRGVASLRGAFVAVVQAADLWNGDDTARRQRRDRTWKKCILVQAEVRSRVIGNVLGQNPPKAGRR